MGGYAMFGGGYGESEPVDVTPKEYKELRPTIASQILSWLGGGAPQYTGPFTAPMTSAESTTLGNLQTMAGGSDLETAARGYLSEALAGRYLTPESNPFLASYIRAAQRPALEAYDEARLADKILFTGAGQAIQRGSPYAAARARSDEALANMLKDISTGIAFPAYQQERQIQAAAPAETREMDLARFQRGIQNLEAQALPRLIEQYGIDAGIQEFNRRRDLLFQVLGLGAGVSAPTLGQESFTISGQTAGGGGATGGGGAGGGGLATA